MSTTNNNEKTETYAFAMKETSPDKALELLRIRHGNTGDDDDDATASKPAVRVRIDRIGLSANNKFYVGFGRRSPFQFFWAYPVSETSTKVSENDQVVGKDETYVHPPVWGICTVTESTEPEIAVGTRYRAMLPIGNQLALAQVQSLPHGDFSYIRPATLSAYNTFTRVPEDFIEAGNDVKADLAMVCFPGIVTGYGLFQQLKRENYYRKNKNDDQEERIIVVTSASSKVSLALAFYLKQGNPPNVKILGYTSESNKEFCQKTGYYHQLLGYDDPLPPTDKAGAIHVLVDVAGQGKIYQQQQKRLVKALVVGNAHDVSDAVGTGKQLGILAMLQLILAMMGFSTTWMRWLGLVPKLEMFLIFTILQELSKEWGEAKRREQLEQAARDFCNALMESKLITVRACETVESIQKAFADIMQGKVPPSEAIVLDVNKAVAKMK